jgi:hypothetical protein
MKPPLCGEITQGPSANSRKIWGEDPGASGYLGPQTSLMIGNALSRLALSGLGRRDSVDVELVWPGNPGHIGGLTNEQIDSLLEHMDRQAGRPHSSLAG